MMMTDQQFDSAVHRIDPIVRSADKVAVLWMCQRMGGWGESKEEGHNHG